MIVSASTDCFEEMPLLDVYERLTDLEFSNVEIAIRDGSIHLTPEQVLADEEKAIAICRDTHRMGITGYTVEIGATGEAHYDQFAACCRLAKATKVASLTVPSAAIKVPDMTPEVFLRR